VPGPIDGVSIITPPAVTEKIVAQAVSLGIKHIWMQPGAESPAAVALAKDAGANVIAGGPCILVALHYRED
jgi:predicted CoA-binding protein